MPSRNQMTAEHSISWMQPPRLSWMSSQISSLHTALAMNIGTPNCIRSLSRVIPDPSSFKLRLPQILRPLRKAVKVWLLAPIQTPEHWCKSSKLVTTIVSTFTAYYIHLWSTHFPEVSLSAPLPSFDGRAVQYPSVQNLRDYMSWRQVDCEIGL